MNQVPRKSYTTLRPLEEVLRQALAVAEHREAQSAIGFHRR
jgi:hypothetical protein